MTSEKMLTAKPLISLKIMDLNNHSLEAEALAVDHNTKLTLYILFCSWTSKHGHTELIDTGTKSEMFEIGNI